MDVDATSFPARLLEILTHISEAEFVAFDLELSGIASRVHGAPNPGGKRTLADRYLEVKQAAEKYGILQVGITTVKFDHVTKSYVLRPYNFNLSPLVGERLNIERDITFQAGAVEFLLKNGFKMDLPFTQGIQYLSREEAERALTLAYNRIEKRNVVEDLQLTENDVESLDFVRRVREAILDWKSGKGGYELCITTHTGLEQQPSTQAISNFEKRLVHQLVRAEFKDLVTISHYNMIRIISYNEDREKLNTKKAKDRVKGQIAAQTGFRWIIEALIQGDIHTIDPMYFARDPSRMVIAVDAEGMKTKFDRTALRIKSRQPVLVGHNMFTDLLYLYHTFIRPLPPTLQEFQKEAHKLCPRIVDTKYLATHAGGDLNASPTLQDIAERLSTQPLPELVTHRNHDKYHGTEAHHEAGYDSLLTATIMLRLSAKLKVEQLEAKAVQPKTSQDSFVSAVEHQDIMSSADVAAEGGGIQLALEPRKEGSGSFEILSPRPAQPEVFSATPEQTSSGNKKHKKRSRNKAGSIASSPPRRFASNNVYEELKQVRVDDAFNMRDITNAKFDSTDPTSWQDEPYVAPGSAAWVSIEQHQRNPMETIPDFGVEGEVFWKEFGNRLRTFGTKENMLKIAEWPEASL